MPIRAEMRHLYPSKAEWKALRKRILARANNACECSGECGDQHAGGTCGLPNGFFIKRTGSAWSKHHGCSLCLGGDPECKSTRIVLTIAHLDHNPANSDETNILAMCQRCHLRLDAEEHAKNAAATRARKRDAATGQTSLTSETNKTSRRTP